MITFQLSNKRTPQNNYVTPASPLLTMLIYVSPSYWTIYLSFQIVLEMGSLHWFGLQIQCSIPGFLNLWAMGHLIVMGMLK